MSEGPGRPLICRDAEYLRMIARFQREHGRAPSVVQVAGGLGIGKRTAQRAVDRLLATGALRGPKYDIAPNGRKKARMRHIDKGR